MSLINQVLKDLDRRHAAATVIPPSARSVSVSAPSQPASRWPKVLLAAAAGATLAVAAALAWRSAQGGEPPTAARQAAAAQTAAVGVSSAGSLPLVAPAPGGESIAAPVVASLVPANVMPVAPALAPIASMGTPSEGAASTSTPSASTAPVIASPSDAPHHSANAAKSTPALASSSSPTAPVRSSPESGAARPLPADITGANPPAAPVLLAVSVEKRARPVAPRERAELGYQRGLALHQQGQAEDAETAFAAALSDDRHHAAARRALAISLAGRSQPDNAQRLLDEGLELNPQQLQFAAVLARIKAERGDLNGAIETLGAALAAGPAGAGRPGYAEARALLATLQQRLGNHAAAIDNFGAALQLEPASGPWWIGLGLSLHAEGRFESAREALARARESDSLSPELLRFVDQRLRLAAH